MRFSKVPLLLSLTLLLVIGGCLLAVAQDKPILERSKTVLSPNVLAPTPDPNWELKAELNRTEDPREYNPEGPPSDNEPFLHEDIASKVGPPRGPAEVKMSPQSEILGEDFEVSVPPPGWSAITTHSDTTTWYQNDYNPYSGTYYADCKYDENLVPQDEWLITPSMDFSSVNSDIKVEFYWFMSYYWGVDPYDNYDLQLHIIVGSDTTMLWSEADAGVFTNWEWNKATVSLAAYVGQTDVKLAWRYVGVDGAEAGLDFVSVNDNPAPVGRCCYGDPASPSCDDLTEAECSSLGGTWSDGLSCSTDPCPVAGVGDNCDNPITITLPAELPYSDLNQYSSGMASYC